MTGCDAVPALDGAHLHAYRGPECNAVTNGLLLRADIHTLFDLRLWAPDGDTRAIVVFQAARRDTVRCPVSEPAG